MSDILTLEEENLANKRVTRTGWLKDNDGVLFAPKTLSSLIYVTEYDKDGNVIINENTPLLTKKLEEKFLELSRLATHENDGLMSKDDKIKVDTTATVIVTTQTEYENMSKDKDTLYAIIDGIDDANSMDSSNIIYSNSSLSNISNVRQALDKTLEKVNKNAEDINNFSDEIGAAVEELQTSFQDGCNKLVAACEKNSVTPANNSPEGIAAAIDEVYTVGYNNGITVGEKGGVKAATIEDHKKDEKGTPFFNSGKSGTRFEWVNNLGDCKLMIYVAVSKSNWDGSSGIYGYIDNDKVFYKDIYSEDYHGIKIKKGQTFRLDARNSNTILNDFIMVAYSFN